MISKTYKLAFLPIFEQDLNEIIDYISNNLQNPNAALKLIDDIDIAINKRLKNPLSFAPYKSNKKRTHIYYRINVKNFSIFYVVIDDIMEVRRILYSKRNFDNFLI